MFLILCSFGREVSRFIPLKSTACSCSAKSLLICMQKYLSTRTSGRLRLSCGLCVLETENLSLQYWMVCGRDGLRSFSSTDYPSGLLTPEQARRFKVIGCLTPRGPQTCCSIGCLTREEQSHFAVQLRHWGQKKDLLLGNLSSVFVL